MILFFLLYHLVQHIFHYDSITRFFILDLSRYNNMIMARVFDHDHLVKLAKFSTVPVINGLTNYNHPCQILSDGFTILEKFGKIENLTISFIGDGNNVFHSWLYMAQRFPLKINIACPKGYEPNNNLVKKTRKIGISTVNITNDPYEIISGSDIVYTDVWASMGQEKESMIRTNKFSPFQVNEKLMKEALQSLLGYHDFSAFQRAGSKRANAWTTIQDVELVRNGDLLNINSL